MGNAIATGVPAPNTPSAQLRLRRGKKNVGCPCFLADEASTWEAVTQDPKFRPYVLRHLLDEGFICSILEHGEREHGLTACGGVQYYQYTEESQRGILREKLEAWQRAAGAGVTACDGLNSESAFGELQLARPLHTYGFLPTLQRRLAVLRELGAAVAEEHRSRCRPFHMRMRSPPPSAGGQEQGDVRLGLMMNSVALQSLSTLASLATTLQSLPSGDGSGHSNVDLIRAPFAMLAELLEKFPSQNLFKYWSPLPSEPEKKLPVDPETATASCSSSLARLAVTGGVHVGWKSTATGASVVTWQVALRVPATELTSVQVQWRAGDPTTGTDQNALPLALSIEASVDGGKEWHGITGGDEAVDLALAHKASPGSSQHRYPVSLLALRRKREPQVEAQKGRSQYTIPAVTHIRLKMKGAPGSRPGGSLSIYDVAINARDPSASPSDVMTVLRQLQTFLLTQHSRDQAALQDCILRALLGVCQASCALEFELDLVRVYMDMENAKTLSLEEGTAGKGDSTGDAANEQVSQSQEEALQAFVSTLLSAACRAKRQACRQDRERVIRDAGFDGTLSSKWVVVSEGGQLVSSAADNGHNHSLLHQCLRRGIWSWELALERESSGDETTCVGVAVNPVTNSCYEDSHQMWMVRCYSGETYSNGGRRNRITRKIHPLDSVRLTLNCDAGTLSLDVNGVDQGVVFSNVPPDVHPAVCFYGIAKSVRLVELKRIYGDSDSDVSDSDGESDAESEPAPTEGASETVSPLRRALRPTTAMALTGDVAETCEVDASSDPNQGSRARSGPCTDTEKVSRGSPKKSSTRRAARREEEAVASTIRAAATDVPSTGLLAGLANFAQWYVPRIQDRDQHGTTNQRSDLDEDGNTMTQTPDSGTLVQRVRRVLPLFPAVAATGDGGWGTAGRTEPPDAESARYVSLDSVSSNNLGWDVSRGGRQSSRLRSMMMGRPSPARRMSTSVAGTGIAHGIFAGGELAEHSRRMTAQATAEVVSGETTTTAQGRKGKALALEEPYIIQPTATVFQKLYVLLVRSLDRLDDGAEVDRVSTASSVLSLLQIMRANFCRLVEAHVDPAEVGLLLDYDRHGMTTVPEARGQDTEERLLSDILRCLQDIMLQQDGNPLLLRATVDTFTSGLPLLMPLVENRLHLLLGLVWHLQSSGSEVCDLAERRSAGEGVPSPTTIGHDASTRLAQIPRERVTLLRDLLTHFARTESVLQLLTLFEEDEAERNAISDLLGLMLTSMADRACPSTKRTSQQGTGGSRVDTTSNNTGNRPIRGSQSHLAGDGGRHSSYWDQLVVAGAGGTTLNFTLLDTCQQHLLCMVLERDRTIDNPHELLLCQYGQCLVQVCCRVLSAESLSTDAKVEDIENPWWQLVGVLLPPFLHGLCMCVDRSRVAEGLLPPLVRLSEVLSDRINRKPSEAAAASSAEEVLRQTQLTNPEEGLALAPSGWHPVRASFEVDKDSMTSFSISEDGQLYSALTSNNTCALVDVGVSQGKAAWEFLLEEDSPSDECSVFGVATKPPYSRCYNSSQSLWMRRAYNGVLYNRGRQLPAAQSMSKIHPGDVVRCEVDIDEGTVRFCVNGEKQDGGFDDIEGEVFPCAGSYRSGVTIRLLKMEVMGGIGLRGGGNNGIGAAGWDPTEISWAPGPYSKRARGGLVSIDKKAIEIKRMGASCGLHQSCPAHSAVVSEVNYLSSSVDRSTRSASGGGSGRGSTQGQRSDACGLEPTREEAITSSPDADMCVGRLEVADTEAWEWVSVRATRGFTALQGKHSVEMEVTPVGTRRRRAGSTKSSGSEDRNALRRYPMAFGLCTGTAPSLDGPVGTLNGSWGWWTDGSLRAHGEVLIPAAATDETLFGSEFLPLKALDVITMVADTLEGTLRYLVNGMDAGIAFGPPGSGAVCEMPDGTAPFALGTDTVLFPSCSLTNDKQVVQLRPGGTLGTQLWPLAVDLLKTVASLVGRLCATLVAGTPQDEAEVALEPWLRSPLLSGGVQASEDILGESAWQSLGRRSWDKAWSAEQQGRLVRTRSFMAWGGGSEDILHPGISRGEFEATGAEDCAGSGGQSRSLSDGDIRVTARVVQATNIPQGLVLWPEFPCVRVTATVDGRDVSCQEEILNTSKSSSPATSSEKAEQDDGPSVKTCTDGQPRHGEVVLELQLPEMRAMLDEESDPPPDLWLRVEILVGRVVTATGRVDLRGELKASLSGSSTRRTVLSLTGGCEIVFILSLSRDSTLSASSREVLPHGHTGMPTLSSVCEGDWPQTNDAPLEVGPKDTRAEGFLDSIACWGLKESSDGAARIGNSKSSPMASATAEAPPVGVAEGETSVGGSNERHLGSGGQDSLFPHLVEWLGRSHPDPVFLRMALEKTNNYAFPLVEAPFLAALLKHGGLVSEALLAAEKLSTWDKEIDEEPPVPAPTRDMAKLWGRVRQLRAFLRTQKQEYKITATESRTSETSVASGVSASGAESVNTAQQDALDETLEDEKNDVGAEMEEKNESSSDAQARSNDGDQEAFPTTFEDLCGQITERANFLLELSPSTIQSPSAAAEDTSVLMHHLAEELSDLPAPPPARLQSRLLRWRSEDRGKERWKGVVDVLRVQSQLRRTLSMAHRPRAKSLGNRPAEPALLQAQNSERSVFNPCIEEGQAFIGHESSEARDPARSRTRSFGNVDGDSGCNSGEDSDDSGKGALLENETATSAAIQACTMYVITGGAVAPPQVLKASLRSRTARAAMREFGLQALAAFIRTLSPEEPVAMSVGASSAVQEALVFLRPAFQGLRVKQDKEGREVEVTSDERDTRHHYLKGLEGCSAGLLARVQAAFEDLYGLLRTLLDHSLRTGQPGLAHVLMTSWALDFESRDYRFLAHKSGILPTLQAMVTLTSTASLATSSLDSLNDESPGPLKEAIGNEGSGIVTALQNWTPWSLENIREGFIQGTLMARDLARHINRIPTAALPSGFLEEAGLHGCASDILRRHSMASLMRRYSALVRVHLAHAEARLTKMDKEAALKRKRLEEIGRERVSQMLSRGVPVLDEREGKKSPEVQLTALCSWATVPVVASVACTFARGVAYACSPVGEAHAGLAPYTNSGNYFEVTVMNPGEKTTIGIGLADPDVFPATKQMPGWVDHSYGYHGDDGRKFGRGKTDSIWPTWVDGDVIGCGFDAVRGSIWYTRNGELLGDGFIPVFESNLVPVVGFHSNGESVRVNFGVVPFAYGGPEVIIAPVVLAERELLQREARDLNPADNICVDHVDETAEEEKAEGDLAEEKEPTAEEKTVDSAKELGGQTEHVPGKQVQKEIASEMMVPSMKVLQRGASSLLRFLVAVSMRQASLAGSVESGEGGVQNSPDEAPSGPEDARHVARGAQEQSSSKVDGGAAAAALPPARERSMYGTPLTQMQTHVDTLHQDIFDLILRELRLGALALEHIFSTCSSRTGARGSADQNDVAFDGGAKAKSFAVGRIPKQEMRRSYSHGHSQASTCSMAWKGLNGADHVDAEREDASAETLGLAALEIGEVEPHMFRQLALLCSVRQYAITRTQLAHPSALRSIFSLLKVGSPRMQRCVLVLLGAVLPGMEPSVTDDYLPQAWMGCDQTGGPSSSFHHSIRSGPRKDQASGGVGRSPHTFDGLVGVLFSTVRHAYSSPPCVPGSVPFENSRTVDSGSKTNMGCDGVGCDLAGDQSHSRGQCRLAPGCDDGFGGGMLDLGLAEQCSSLLRVLYEEPAWKELIARKLLLSIRTATSAIRASSSSLHTAGPRGDSPCHSPAEQALPDVVSDAVAAMAIIAGGSGVLYPGAQVQSKSGVLGTVVLFSAGDAEAGVVFDGENVETCERVLVQDLEAADVGFRADPDTPAQPVVAQVLSLLRALLHSDEVSQALSLADSERLAGDVRAMVWLRVLSQSLMAVLQLSVHCSDTLVAACQEADVVTHVLPELLEVAMCPIQIPALITAQDFELRWRSGQARILSALRLGDGGLRTLRPIQRHPLPPPDASTTAEESHEKPVAPKARLAHPPSGSRDALSAEESREEALSLLHPRRHTEYSDPVLEAARSARMGGWGRLMTLGDPHRSWGRGWGSAMSGRRAVGSLDWVGRATREEDDPRRGEGGRRRLMRSDLSHRMAARGRRAASAESRLDSRRPGGRVFHEYDRSEGLAEYRDDESGALLVEFNDGADGETEGREEASGIEGGSAGSADSGETSQDGDEMESTSSVGNIGGVVSTDEGTDAERGPHSVSPGPPCYLLSEGRSAPIVKGCDAAKAMEGKPPLRSPGFPLSHLLDFGAEARAERHGLSARLSSEVGVPGSTALAALETFGLDVTTARRWLQTSQHAKEVPMGELKVSTNASTPSVAGDIGTVESNVANGATKVTTENSIVSGLIGTDDAGPARNSGEAASVPSAEEGLNLWESEGNVREATDMISMQCAGLLCEHDLVPVLGLPRPAPEVGGTGGRAVTTSCLVREVDLLVPGSLLVVTAGEGYAPDQSCPCVTVASELDYTVGFGRDGVVTDLSSGVGGESGRGVERHEGQRHVTSSPVSLGGARPPPSQDAIPSVMDNEEVLVELMDAETGLCLGQRVPVGDLRHSTSFFGQELDDRGTTVTQLLRDTDKALSILRARSLLVRLIHSLPTPAIAAAGGPRGLLNITRLLAAQDLAKGNAPASFGSISRGDRIDSDQSSVGSVTGHQQAEPVVPKCNRKLVPGCESKLVDTPSSDQDSLLKMLWRKVMDSPKQWISSEEQGSGSAVLGEMLAQEVLDSFNTLTTTSQTMLSGGYAPQESLGAGDSPLPTEATPNESNGAASDGGMLATTESIVHETLHPLCTPLSYGGHIRVDPTCLGMVIKLDSRSRTSSDLLRLQFFSSKEDMLNERNPVRAMHGHVVERAARAKTKGMEFFKIEEADSTFYDRASNSPKETLSLGALTRLAPPPPPPPALPPAPVPQERASSVGPGVSPAPSTSSRRPVLTSRAMTRAMFEVHSQMVARRKTRVKETPMPTNLGSSFRSFALPGVFDLWFRFDAPPGAEKPQLKIVSLAGSLDVANPGTVQASTGGATAPSTSTHHEHHEDVSQEELGLHSLFTCLGEENADGTSLPAETSDKRPKRVDVTDGSKSSEARRQSSEALPGCLATTADLFLTSGKWFYEATVESLVGSPSDGGDADDGLIRVGWAHADLRASLQVAGVRKGSEGDLAGDSYHVGAEQVVEPRTTPEASGGSGRMQGQVQPVGVLAGPLMRTVSWLSESVDSLSSVQEDTSKQADTCPTDEDMSWSNAGGAEGAYVVADGDNNERSRKATKLKSVTFPILGSDAKSLGVGLGQEGCVWVGGRPRVQKTSSFAPSDVLGCAVDIDLGAAWFSVNGRWAGGTIGGQDGAVMLKMLGWRHDGGVRNGISPCFSVRGKSSVSVNFGAVPFKYPPPGQEFLPVVLRDVPIARPEDVALAAQGSDKRVTFAPEAKPSSAANLSVPDDWGFRFVVDPLHGVHYRVVRELELICRFGGRTRSGSASSTAGATFGPQTISIWRPKAPPGWFSVGDVASRGLLPPPGAVVVRADATGCLVSKPAKFRVVHQDKATGFVVWRPVARQGQVSLGDFACAKKASKGIMAGAVRCVAAWAVEACPVVKCLWREEKQSGTHAIWSSQNGLGTFFGSQTGGRMGKKEVTQGPHSRVERQKRKKKKKKKKGSAGEESSEEDEGERIKLQFGVGEGWALKGVSSSCITNEWCQESDVISGPFAQRSHTVSPTPSPPSPGATDRLGERKRDDPRWQRTSDGKEEMAAARIVRKPQPSVSWASWLLPFLLNHPPLRRLAMRGSLFRTLVAYLRSPGAPHRLRMVPLLTLLVRSHAEFAESPPPLEELSGLLAAVLRECDKLTSGRGPRSSAWRSGDCPGGLQLETSWANAGLLLLTDLAMTTRRAQDAISQRPAGMLQSPQSPDSRVEGPTRVEMRLEDVHEVSGGSDAREGMLQGGSEVTTGSETVAICVPPFGTRLDEGPMEEGEQEEAEEAENGERSLADRVLVGGRSLGTEDRALLEEDVRNSVLPDFKGFSPSTTASFASSNLQGATAKEEPPSRCLHHLLEILDTVRALRDGWPSLSVSNPTSSEALPPAAKGPLYLDSILCEAWMDAVGPAVVMESEHPFRKGTHSETIRFPGAEELVVFLDPRSSMQEDAASLVLEGKDKMISITGQKEAPWGDVITFRGDAITYRFVAETDGKVGAANSLATSDPQEDDWGFRFTVVADGPVWECARIEGQFGAGALDEAPDYEAEVQGALSLLVELDQMRPVPPGCNLQVFGFTAERAPVHAGVLGEGSPQVPIYVRGDKVRVVPLQKDVVGVDHAADSKEVFDPNVGNGVALETKNAATTAQGEPRNPAPESSQLVDLGALPDADTKLERLPSNTPVLRAWGEATGVERRWRSASEADDSNGMAFPGASYVSNAATVEVGDSDADSKDGSSNNSPSSSLRARGTWSRYPTLDDAIATALPVLSAVDSDITDSARLEPENVAVAVESSMAIGTSCPDGPIHGTVGQDEGSGHRAGIEGGQDERGDDIRSERESTGSFRPRACAGAKDVTEEGVENRAVECSSSPPRNWAVRVQTAAMPRKARLRLYLEQRLSHSSRGPTLEVARDWMKMWTPEMDKGLLELLGAAGTRAKDEAAPMRLADALNPWCCRLTRAEAKFQQQCLAGVPAASLHIRAALMLRLNDRIERVLPVIDLASKQADSLGWQLREMNHLILPHIKNAVLEAALAATQGPGDGVAVTLDNIKSMLSRDRGERDLASSQCVFAQAYRQLSDTNPKLLRTVWDGERVFQINFVGEDGVDAGGVFREGMSRMVEDLFSPDFDLLVQCPNGRHAVGQNNEKYVPNPQHSSPLALSMLRFVGRLMGLSLRTRLCLPFQLPGLIWKRILGLHVGFEDLSMVDTIITQFVTAIRTCENDGLTSDEEFREMYGERLFFTYTGSDGVERELTPGGVARRVTFDNRLAFCRMVEQARTHEFDAQAAAMAAGLSDIVPIKVLRLFTAAQLEIAVAGEPEFDIAFWKEHTEYKGYRPDDDTVEFFWKVIESMSSEDQSGFVRFAWGRSRLPPKAFWRVDMKLLRSNMSEESLPVSHTCFFSIELPPYTTEERMRKGLLTAIHFGMGGILNA